MRKGLIITIILFIIICLTAIITVMIINDNDLEDNSTILEKRNLTNINDEENTINSNINLVETAVQEEKVSPNCMFIFKTYYARCDHIKVEKEQASEVMVNKTREDLEKIYKDWQVVTFRSNEVLFYKEEESICNEHYMLREVDGNIAIYLVDENEKETLKEITSIVTTYLPQEDIERLKNGIRVDGKEQLNQTLEDYE